MRSGFDGAIATSRRPHGPSGRPGADFASSFFHVAPPSSVRKRPDPEVPFGPSPPDRNVQPLRRNSQRPAKRRSGLRGAVERLAPFGTRAHLFPPSVVL